MNAARAPARLALPLALPSASLRCNTESVFGSLGVGEFLGRYWQRSPLVLPAAFPDFASPISAADLAGLACEPEVEARLVQGRVDTSFRLEHGPFDAERFERLPERDWTLLVQDVDKYVPEVAALLQHFRFIPDWRIDDIMISYAAPGGSVGPHTDQYDVFLLQAGGHRRWQLSESFNPALRGDSALGILEQFAPEREFVAAPGDVLYLPPNVAHFGVALDEAMTLSIGFRAPDQRELVFAYAEELAERASASLRFGDPGRPIAADPTQLASGDLERLRQLLRSALQPSDAELDAFVGRYLTRSKPHLWVAGEASSVEELARRLAAGERLVRRLGARLLQHRRAGAVWLFADGERYELELADLAWLEPLLSGSPLPAGLLEERPNALATLAALLGQGTLEWLAPKGA